MDLCERTVDRLARRRQPETTSRDHPESHDNRFVVVEHEWRKPIAGTNAVAAADTALTLDRDAEILQGGDVAPDRTAIDPQAVRDLGTGREWLRLEKLEQFEQPSGWRLHHARSQSEIEGENRPINRIACLAIRRTGGGDDYCSADREHSP